MMDRAEQVAELRSAAAGVENRSDVAEVARLIVRALPILFSKSEPDPDQDMVIGTMMFTVFQTAGVFKQFVCAGLEYGFEKGWLTRGDYVKLTSKGRKVGKPQRAPKEKHPWNAIWGMGGIRDGNDMRKPPDEIYKALRKIGIPEKKARRWAWHKDVTVTKPGVFGPASVLVSRDKLKAHLAKLGVL